MLSQRSVRVRIAPSPTGMMHVGTARAALFNWLFAKRYDGEYIVRIEDTDRARSSDEFIASILGGLEWLGLNWDELHHQSQRLDFHREVAARLISSGSAYWCYCTPAELEVRRKKMRAEGLPPRYDRRCRELPGSLEGDERPKVLRFKIPLEGDTIFQDLVHGELNTRHDELDDFILLKSDGGASYQLANVADDHEMQITHVIRGDDFIPSTPRQILIYEALGWDRPQFAHLPMILGVDRSKLSKRHGATGLLEYREMGVLPEAMLNFLTLLGWAPGKGEKEELFGRDELIKRFDLSDVNSSGAVFDVEKLEWMNSHYIRGCSPERLTELCVPYFQSAGLVSDELDDPQRCYAERVLILEQERMRLLSEAPTLCHFFFRDDFDYDEKATSRLLKDSEVGDMLIQLQNRLEALDEYTDTGIEAVIRELAKVREVKAGQIIHPTRAALTGRTTGPPLFEMMAVLGRDRCIDRLRRCVGWMAGMNTSG